MHQRLPLAVRTVDTDEQDDDALIRAAQADRAAFAGVYDRYLARVYRYLRARIPGEEDAADLTQEVFVRAMDGLPAYRPRGLPFAAWLFRIARNAVTDMHRRRRDTRSLDGLPVQAHPPGDDDPEAAVLRGEALRALLDHLRRLGPAKRELLALRFAAGLTAREIALVMGKSEGAIKKQMSRTLNQLKEHYRATEDPTLGQPDECSRRP